MSRHTRYQAFIIQDHQVLLIKHREHESGRAYWVIPGGGREDGETELECVVREAKEETNLDVQIERLLFDEPGHPGGVYQWRKSYLCRPVGGEAAPGYEPEIEASEFYGIVEVRWFDLRDETGWDERLYEDVFTYPQIVKLRTALGYLDGDIQLRDVIDSDLPIFFEQQLDPQANYMAAFTAKNPADRKAFDAHWARILSDETILIKTILFEGQVAGSVLKYEQEGVPEVSYWLGKEYWGRGFATQALSKFLRLVETRPIVARAAKDNLGSLRVLEKCGFRITGEDRGYANARGQETEEYLLQLGGPAS